jgi:hypothetical protein
MREKEGQAISTLTMAAGSVEHANRIIAELDRLESMPAVVDGQPSAAYTEQQLKVRALIQEAGGKAATIILQAAADRWRMHMGERTRLADYQGQLGTYRANPALFRASHYLESLRTALADARIFITDSRFTIEPRVNLEDQQSMMDVFSTQPRD